MRILALNCGSSSIKCAVVDSDTGARSFEARLDLNGSDASATLLDMLRSRWADIGKLDAVVHRVVHGGNRFREPVLVDDAALAELSTLDRLAPLHNPPALRAIRGTRGLFASVPQVMVFDTAFHSTLPPRASEYPLPAEVRERFGIRRYGFHGISHADVSMRVAGYLRKTPQELRLISCHLGSGASITAVEYGRSVETSMGMTPLEGLVMATRAGDLDPGILLELAREFPPDELATLLNERAGLAGLTGTGDLRAIEQRASEGDEACRLALAVYAHRIRKYLGAYAAVMGGVDVIAFTGGVGEHSALMRHRCAQRLEFLGALLDEDANRNARLGPDATILDIGRPDSRVGILIIRADEERAMAAAAASLLREAKPVARIRVPVAISARHAHLSQATLDRLFGVGHQLQPQHELSQTGQFAAQESIALIGPRGRIEHVRLMGPPRARDQVEISRSDEFTLGLDAPVRISGDLANTPGITLEGPNGRVTIPNGVICARRHLHMSPVDAMRLGVGDCDSVAVKIDSAGRDLTFSDVSVRVAPHFALELHLDTDEANAAGVATGDFADIIAGVSA